MIPFKREFRTIQINDKNITAYVAVDIKFQDKLETYRPPKELVDVLLNKSMLLSATVYASFQDIFVTHGIQEFPVPSTDLTNGVESVLKETEAIDTVLAELTKKLERIYQLLKPEMDHTK